MLISVLVMIAAVGLAVQALIGLSFFISSVREGEKRASVFAGFQFLGIFSAMDDLFYGRKPKPKAPPNWVRFTEKERRE